MALRRRAAQGAKDTSSKPTAIEMRSPRMNGWRWVSWALVALVLLGGTGLWVVQETRRGAAFRRHKFPVPLPDRMAADSAVGRGSSAVPDNQLMTLDPTKKFLVNSITKKPVFITGDAAWSLQGQLSDPDIELYLSDRAARGFNLIIVDIAENYYSNNPPKDYYGNVPFNGADFTNENEAYWSRVNHTMQRAAAFGITVMADPAFVGYGCNGGYCESYRHSSTDVLRAYGQFLGNRYKGFPNIIWLIGGDAHPADSNVQSKLCALARGIKSVDTVHLMTTENYRGTSSADVWSESPWLDLDALYLEPADIPAKAKTAYLAGRYPVFLLEDWYEGEHSITELGAREEGYWAVLSGSTIGRIFGNYAIWNFSWPHGTTDPWKNQLGSTGSVGQAWMGKLLRSREHWKLVPDINHTVMIAGYDRRPFLSSAREFLHSLVYRQPLRSAMMLSVAARTSDGQTIVAYLPYGNAATITIDMSKITDARFLAKSWWFNPRDGSSTLISSIATCGTHKFTPPDGNDWVLVIDSQSASLAAPGAADL
jgi:hypothetical protein